MIKKRVFGFLLTALVALLALWSLSSGATERVYYIAAEEVDWEYMPVQENRMMGRLLNDEEKIFTASTNDLIGSQYKKAVFYAYTNENFNQRVKRVQNEKHLGVLGPLIRAEVGDTIKLVFKNKASRPYTVHPHGVFYEKHSEGVPYADGTTGKDKADDNVAPGKTYTYIWEVPERAGPGPNDGSSIAWLYHSHVDEVKDTNTGLVGAIIVTRKGMANTDGSPKDIDRELVTLFTVMDENQSWYLDENIRHYTGAEQSDEHEAQEEFEESNLMHSINGYLYGNIPGLDMKVGDKVRWYQLALGTEVDLHTPHWHGNTGLYAGRRVDVVELLPATMKVVDMTPDNPGIWMFHCHVNDHLSAGMSALYTVLE